MIIMILYVKKQVQFVPIQSVGWYTTKYMMLQWKKVKKTTQAWV